MNKEAEFETTHGPVSASSAGLGRSSASDLIERLESETGQRFDSNGGDNATMAGLFGALSRMMGQHQFDERDDVAVGLLIRHQMTPEYAAEQRSRMLMAEMLAGGMSPDDLKKLMG